MTSDRPAVMTAVWLDKPDTLFCDLLIALGIDVAVIDCEHGSFSQEAVWDLIALLGAGGVAPFVRIPSLSRTNVMQPLDWGAEGLIVPGVRTADEVSTAIDYATYPPAGSRGWGPRRAAMHTSAQANRAAHIENENRRKVIWAQIETADALTNLDAIVATPQLGGVLVGPMDLSGDVGVGVGNVQHPTTQEAIQRVVKSAVAASLPVGVVEPSASPEILAERVDAGCVFVSIGTQLGLMTTALQTRLSGLEVLMDQES